MPQAIPSNITIENVRAALRDLDAGATHEFGPSIGYDLVDGDKRYPPKAVLGLATLHATNVRLGPYDFKGGESSQAFRVLRSLGFVIERKSARPGVDWNEDEVRLLVDDYFDMLTDELERRQYSKAEHNRALRAHLPGRTKGSIEFKYQNVSGVLLDLNFPFIEGYKPARNYQALLAQVVEEFLGVESELVARIERGAEAIEEAPVRNVADFDALRDDPPIVEPRTRARRRTPRKFDFRRRDEANRALGRAGEEFVVELERARLLKAGRGDLARRVVWLSETIGDGAGYDIESFDTDGSRLFIEVKTTKLGISFPFLLSRNEVEASTEKAGTYRLYRVYGFGTSTRFYVLSGDLRDCLDLAPTTFEATPKATSR